MKVLHVIPSLAAAHGGPSKALPLMAEALAGHGIQVDVATTDDDGPGKTLDSIPHSAPVQQNGFRVFYFHKQTEFYKVSIPMFLWLVKHVSDYDLVHIHAVFSFSTIAAGWACRMRRVPYIVRPLGVLNTWGMRNRRRLIKAWSFRLLDKPVLDHAAAIHYTARQELNEAAPLNIDSRPVVIPLGIHLQPFESLPSPAEFHTRFPETLGKPVVLFLSRLDPKKNIELLLDAFQKVDPPAHLVIAGSGNSDYVARLKARAADLRLQNRVTWTGHLEGEEKLSALAAATLFVLPSHSENFGIALLEAMAAGCACLSSPGVALGVDASTQDAVKVVPPRSDEWTNAINALLMSPESRHRLGQRAQSTSRNRYSTQAMSEALALLYTSLDSRHPTELRVR